MEAAAIKKLHKKKRPVGRPPKRPPTLHKGKAKHQQTPAPASPPPHPPPPPRGESPQPLASSEHPADVGPAMGVGPPVGSPGRVVSQQPPAAKLLQGPACATGVARGTEVAGATKDLTEHAPVKRHYLSKVKPIRAVGEFDYTKLLSQQALVNWG